MTRAARIARFSLGLLTMVGVAACVFTIPFSHTDPIVIDVQGSTLNQVKLIDLSGVSEVQQHKANIKSISLKQAVITVATVDALNTWTNVSGTVALRPATASDTDSSQDLILGTLSAFNITAGHAVTLNGNAALDAFVLSVIKGAGTFKLVVNGSAQGNIGKFTLNVTGSYSFDYET
jgi:hypothetical protein